MQMGVEAPRSAERLSRGSLIRVHWVRAPSQSTRLILSETQKVIDCFTHPLIMTPMNQVSA